LFTDFVVVGVQPTDVAKFYEIPAMYRPVEVVVTRDFVTVGELIFCPLTVCPYELCVFAGHGEGRLSRPQGKRRRPRGGLVRGLRQMRAGVGTQGECPYGSVV
jgi:hypothetical protein